MERFFDEFQIGKQLAEGSFGQVMIARPTRSRLVKMPEGHLGRVSADDGHEKLDQRGCVVRVVVLPQDGKRSSEISAFENEVSVLKHLGSHPHVAQILGHFKSKMRCYLVLEHCRCSLFSLMEWGLPANELDASRSLRQMLLAIAYVHGCGVVHRDIQPRNFLLGGPTGRDLKLTGFGCASRTGSHLRGGSGFLGSLEFVAPEMFNPGVYGSAVDVWSFGVVAHLMLYRRLPFGHKRTARPWRPGAPPCKLARPGWEPCQAAEDFVRGALVCDAEERSTAAACLASPFIELPSLVAGAQRRGPDLGKNTYAPATITGTPRGAQGSEERKTTSGRA